MNQTADKQKKDKKKKKKKGLNGLNNADLVTPSTVFQASPRVQLTNFQIDDSGLLHFSAFESDRGAAEFSIPLSIQITKSMSVLIDGLIGRLKF